MSIRAFFVLLALGGVFSGFPNCVEELWVNGLDGNDATPCLPESPCASIEQVLNMTME